MPIINPRRDSNSLTEAQVYLKERSENDLESISRSFKVYHLDFADVLNKKFKEDVNHVSWMHIVDRGDNELYGVEVMVRDNNHSFHSKHHTSLISDYHRFLNEHNEHPNLSDSDYEHALLRISVSRISAIWIVNKRNSKDYYIPLSPAFHGIEPGIILDEEAFFEKVHTAALEQFEDFD